MTPEQSERPISAQEFEFEPLERARNYRRALVREFTPFLQGNVLEVGAGVGHITQLLTEVPSVRRVVAVEPEASFMPRLSKVLPEESIIAGSVQDVREDSWNALVCVNVLEHIEKDEGELASYCSLLRREQGCLCLFVPARQELYAPIDRDFGHYRRYHRPDLSRKLRQAGFDIVRLQYYNSIGYFIWWWNFKVLKNRRFDLGKIVVFDRFIFPIIHAIESRLMAPPLGQSLLAVARARK